QGDRSGLAGLAASVAAGARRAGAPPAGGNRGFRPHLTLARCRAPADVRLLVDALAGYAGTPWTATEIYLIRSRLSGSPRYETVAACPLRRRPERPQGMSGRTPERPHGVSRPGQSRSAM
ncbi:MAG: hypothetical protein J2P34_12840, partial [Actinobacteria bacterium]|nr:hypothetical protein [Actinomycetota bacterium]